LLFIHKNDATPPVRQMTARSPTTYLRTRLTARMSDDSLSGGSRFDL
jgi:hypothetical protein